MSSLATKFLRAATRKLSSDAAAAPVADPDLLFADTSLVINRDLGSLQFRMTPQVEWELQKQLPKKQIPMPPNLTRSNKARSSKFADVSYFDSLTEFKKTDWDWRSWIQVPPTSILVTSDKEFAKLADFCSPMAKQAFGELAPVALIIPKDSYAQAGRKFRWAGIYLLACFQSMEEFEESLRAAGWSQKAWVEKCSYLCRSEK